MSHQCQFAVTFLFYAISEGKIRNLGHGKKIGTFWGPFLDFGSNWDQVPNLGPYWKH